MCQHHIPNHPKTHNTAVLVNGPPACGKGTQSRIIPHAIHISTGELARKKRGICRVFEEQYGYLLDQGEYLPDKVVLNLIKEELPRLHQRNGVFIGDGTIRTRFQARQLGTIFANPKFMLGFNIFVSEEVSLLRAEHRAKTEGRSDDFDLETVLNRYRNWEKNFEAVNGVLKSQGVKLVNIDGERTPEQIHKEILSKLNAHNDRLKREWESASSFGRRRKSRTRTSA